MDDAYRTEKDVDVRERLLLVRRVLVDNEQAARVALSDNLPISLAKVLRSNSKAANVELYLIHLQKSMLFTLYIERYFHDFKNAVDGYISGLGSGLDKMEKALKDKSILV